MNKNEDKFSGKDKIKLTEESLDGVSGGKDYKIHELVYKDLEGNIVRIVRTTKIYSNSGKFLEEKKEVIDY